LNGDNEKRLKEVVGLVWAQKFVLLLVLGPHGVESPWEKVKVHEVLVVVVAHLLIL
jgi:hypothetical protein